MEKMDKIDASNLKKCPPVFEIGDTVDVQVKVREGEKERIQLFSGVVIKMKGRGIRETFTVRRLVGGEGVERIFPLHAPTVAGVQVKKKGIVRRAKLYYLRDRVGKATKLREKMFDRAESDAQAASATAANAAAAAATAAAAAPAK